MPKPRHISWSWVIVIGLALLAIGLGIVGFTRHLESVRADASVGQAIYLTLQLFTLESGAVSPIGPELQIARFLAPLVAAYAILRAMLSLMSIEAQRAWIWLRGGHVVVCGLGTTGIRLVEQMRSAGERVIVIESNESNDDLLHSRELGAVVLIGSADDEWVLRKALVDRARAIIAVTGDDHANVETAVLARSLNNARRDVPLRCIIHVTDPHLERVLRTHDIHSRDDDPFELEFFNTFEIAARIMLREPPVSLLGDRREMAQPHLLIVGLGQLGQTLLWRAARDWRIDRGDGKSRLRVTIIDKEAGLRREWLKARFPRLEEAVELHFLPLDVHSHAFISGNFQCDDVAENASYTAAYICLRDDSPGMYAAMNLRRCLPARVPVIVSMSRRGGMSTLLDSEHKGDVPSIIRVIGLLDVACTWQRLQGGAREVLAQALHQSYVAYRLAESPESADDPSLAPWHQLAEELRASNRQQADQIRVRLAANGFDLIPKPEGDITLIGFSLEELDVLARTEHKRWVDEQLLAGWRYGPTKDREQRISPFLVGWNELPEKDRQYNRDLTKTLPAVMAKADYEIRRRIDNAPSAHE